MSSKTNHFRIGLFVLIGGALFVAALFAMGLRSYFGKRDVYETFVTGKVENLSVGALVKLRGVTVGKVSSIEFAGSEYPGFKDRYVVIQFEVPAGTVWAEGSGGIQQALNAEAERGLRARVQSQGFLGASILALEYVNTNMYPIEPLPWTPKHYYVPSAPSQFNHLLASLEKSLYHAEDLDLADLLARATTLINTANRLALNVNRVDFNGIGANADSLLIDLRDTNRGLQRTLDDAQGAIGDAQKAIDGANLPGVAGALSTNTVALEARLSAAALDLRRTLSSINTGELNDSLLNIRAATDELIALLHKLEQRPSSVLISGSPKPVPEMEKPPRK